ncbi:hypothetical protein HPB48_013584 [Haemaphysalis longicornis]|uniref:Uncharacterized protein n=1 Tax=Haemaphysalis longicornis TaxID=44386 RepID=A0A9J6H588_HAELO|nr:hypothetical protein HPB48_013584 [Haemaphysalis longicornis]
MHSKNSYTKSSAATKTWWQQQTAITPITREHQHHKQTTQEGKLEGTPTVCTAARQLQIIQSAKKPPDVIMVHEAYAEDAPSLSGYRAYASPPSARACGKGAAQGVCTFVRRGIPFVKHEDLLGRSALEYCATEVVLGKKKEGIHPPDERI